MGQERCININNSGCGGRLKRRRNVALATTAFFASSSSSSSSSTTSAFTTPPKMPLHCYAQQQSSLKAPFPIDDKLLSSHTKKSGVIHSSQLGSRALNMVSFLEVPQTVSAPGTAINNRRPVRARGPNNNRVNKGRSIPKDTRSTTVEIDVQPEYDFFGLSDSNDFVTLTRPPSPSPSYETNAKQQSVSEDSIPTINDDFYDSVITSSVQIIDPPGLDSEILYEGITRAVVTQKGQNTASTNNNDNAEVKSANKSTSSSSTKEKAKGKTKQKTKSKSSTMPGFIKDDELDAHIANLDLRRLPSTQGTRKLTRMVKSKKAKLKRRKTNNDIMYKKSASVPDSMVDYAREIHSVDRVTPKEEKELGTKTQEGIRLQQLHDELQNKHGRDPTDDEWAAAAGKMNVVALREAIDDGMAAKNQLVASNLRMVQRVVNLYIRNGLGSEYNAGDLMQDGTMALIRAAEKYEPDRGFRFSTYAMYWIRSAVKRSQTSQSRIVTVPQRLHETHKRIAKNEVQLLKELGRQPTKAELAEACEITTLQLERCQKAMSQVTFSLDAEVQNTYKPNSSTNRKDTMYDIVEGKVDETEYERTQRLLMKDHLIGTLRRYLSPHEVDLLLLRYGLMDERALPKGMSGPLTIAEVSKLVGLKPDKVRRIIINSQKQLRHLMTDDWKDFEYEIA